MKAFDMPEILFHETDNACALCGARGSEILTIHHIDENREHNHYDNLIVLCHNCHNPYHDPNKNIPTKEQVFGRKRSLIHKTVTTFGINALKIAKRNNFGVIAFPYMLYHLCELGYMKKEETQMGYGKIEDATSRFSITEGGINLLNKWFLP
ncbi:HNH endonuclease [Desulfospira joergensenii]|uniref:HNH endonuclease n=1 Tax=Desulfospira joergensenii TaxID=53329 RepID=UPI0003B53605|nr:HNH endonuclease [Desulfospira joergensenii]